MRFKLKGLLFALGLMGFNVCAASPSDPVIDWNTVPLPSLKGGALAPDLFQGKVVLLVNTASQCGFTPQYKGLQALWTAYRDKGLVILGVPSNDFGAQEPGTNTQVAQFCEVNYGVDFPLLEKSHVVGSEAHPLFKWATEITGTIGSPHWNFHKFLIGRDGQLVDWFSSVTSPDAGRLRDAIDKALAGPG